MNTPEGGRRQLVESWLKAMGLTPKLVSDPAALWHLEYHYPRGSGHPMHAVCPKAMPEAVVILSRANIGQDLLDAFAALDADAKDEFLWKLREALMSPHVDFQMEEAFGPLDCPSAIVTTANRFFDGVNLDSFATSVGAVFKAEMSAGWVIARYLAPKTYGNGEQFDFDRLGT